MGFWSGWIEYFNNIFAFFYHQYVGWSDASPFALPGDSGSLVMVDPFRDIAVVGSTGEIIIRDKDGDGDKDICTTCCGPEGGDDAEFPCHHCTSAGQGTPEHLIATFSGIAPCGDGCIQTGEGSYHVDELDMKVWQYSTTIKGAVGLVFAGDKEQTGITIIVPMRDIVEALDLDMVPNEPEKIPAEFVLTHWVGMHCRWSPYIGSSLKEGFYGNITLYSSGDCTGEGTPGTLDGMTIWVDQNWEAGAGGYLWGEVIGWVSTSAHANSESLFFGAAKWPNSICGMIGSHENEIACEDDGATYGGGTMIIKVGRDPGPSDPIIINSWPNKPKGYPSKAAMAKSLAKASFKYIRGGRKKRSEEEQQICCGQSKKTTKGVLKEINQAYKNHRSGSKHSLTDKWFEICKSCKENTWLSKVEYAAWAVKNTGKLIQNFKHTEKIKKLPKQEKTKKRNTLYCRLCKCDMEVKTTLNDPAICKLGKFDKKEPHIIV